MCGAVAVSDYGLPCTYEAIERLMDAKIKTNIHMIFSKANFDSAMKIVYGYNPWLKFASGPKESQVDIDR